MEILNNFKKWSGFNDNSAQINNFWGYVRYSNSNEKRQLTEMYQLAKTKDGISYILQFTRPYFDKVCGVREAANAALLIYVITEPWRTSEIQNTNKYKLIFGKNFFVFAIYDNFNLTPVSISPRGFSCPSNTASIGEINQYCTGNNRGYGHVSCAAKIIQDGWKINY